MKSVYVFLADGFEEIEAVVPVDFMRRAGITVYTVGADKSIVTGAHGMQIVSDIAVPAFVLPQDAAMVVLPGGGLGTQNLLKSEMIERILLQAAERGIYIAAICAAPKVLSKYGLLQQKRVTAFPDVQQDLLGCTVTGAPVEVDGKIITARSAGVALHFAHALTAILVDTSTADGVLYTMYPDT